MTYFFWGVLAGWLLLKQPDWVKNLFAKIAEKTRTGIFKF